MPTNRLRLNFGLNGIEERKSFVDDYVQRPEFIRAPLTEDELETIANYILWGKDSDGLSATQRGEIQIETRNKTWQRDDTESLDALMESPTFNESAFRRTSDLKLKVPREVFDRSRTLSECPDYMVPIFEELFARIDRLEMQIHFYEFAHNKRKEEPRASLTKKFTSEEVESARAIASTWNQFKYLKQRHLIVELRREQFTLRDSYIEKHLRRTPVEPEAEPSNLDFGSEIAVYPLGLFSGPMGALIFQEKQNLNPNAYTEKEIGQILRYYWEKKDAPIPPFYFDFSNLEHVYELFGQLAELEDNINALPLESNLGKLIKTLRYYVDLAELTEAQKEILDFKINKLKNSDIADLVNKKYDKSYTANYISTIFRQKIIPRINDAARLHAEIIENLSFSENFKKCGGCGQYLLISADNFVRKARSKDGFATQCKVCDKNARQRKKEVINAKN